MSDDFTFKSLRDNGAGGHWDTLFARAQGSDRDWTQEKCAAAVEREREHKAWLATEEGAAWFNSVSWNKALPCVRVRKLGLQQIPAAAGGGYVMLYNRLDDKSTVTLASLVKQGYRIEVVK